MSKCSIFLLRNLDINTVSRARGSIYNPSNPFNPLFILIRLIRG